MSIKIKRLLSTIARPCISKEDAAELMALIASYDRVAQEKKNAAT